MNFDTLEGLGHCDVAHRMVQPDQWFSVDLWRTVADRVVVTTLDMIAYRNGAYHEDTGKWLLYRDALRKGCEDADAVVLISEDVKVQFEMERLPVDPQRLHAIPFGTGISRGTSRWTCPRAHGAWFRRRSVHLVPGHGLRPQEQRSRVGGARGSPTPRPCTRPRDGRSDRALRVVPAGRSQLPPAPWADTLESEVFLLPDLPSAERNWLIRHADLVLYPSSAEGFGLVPYEAACFGTPTLFTRFGPLQELAPDIPVAAEDWSPETLAAAADSLLSDPVQARAQIESCLAAGAKYTWAATAEGLTGLYRHVMALAAR